MWNSLPTLSRLFDIAQVLITTATIVTTLLIIMTHFLGNRIKTLEQLERAKDQARIATAEAAGAEVAADLTALEQQNALRDQVAAEKERERAADEARLRAELEGAKTAADAASAKSADAQATASRVAAATHARQITPSQRQRLLESLTHHPPGKVSFTSVLGDGEADGFRRALEALFREARWTVVDGSQAIFSGHVEGLILRVATPSSRAAVAVQQALTVIGFEAPGEIHPDRPVDEVNVVVGHKPAGVP